MEIDKVRLTLLLLIVTLISYGIGFSMGVDTTIRFGVKVIMKLIELKKMNIDIDENMIITGIQQYKNNIGGCLFIN